MLVSSLLVHGLLGELRRRGIREDALTLGSSLTPGQLHNIRSRVPVEVLERLALRALELTEDPAIGLAVGASAPLHALQAVGFLMMACRTMRQAFEMFLCHAEKITGAAEWSLEEADDVVRLSFTPSRTYGDAGRILAEGVLATALRVGRLFVPSARPLEVWFRHERPLYEQQYTDLFQCPIRFDQPHNMLAIERRLFEQEQSYPDEFMVGVLQRTTTQLLRDDAGGTVAEQVRIMLASETNLQGALLVDYARRLGMSERTLRGRLATEATTFGDLVDEERCRVACISLSSHGPSIDEVAARSGFASRSAFHRAFKRWTGVTPFEYAIEHRPQAATSETRKR